MVITFFGHSKLCSNGDLAKEVEEAILSKINKSEKTTFYCGGYGDFDNMCARICSLIKKKGIDCEVLFITPYLQSSKLSEIRSGIDGVLYDGSLYPSLEHVPPKLAILKRNEWMVDNSDLIIAYVKHNWGGAYRALEYARKKGKLIYNIIE